MHGIGAAPWSVFHGGSKGPVRRRKPKKSCVIRRPFGVHIFMVRKKVSRDTLLVSCCLVVRESEMFTERSLHAARVFENSDGGVNRNGP